MSHRGLLSAMGQYVALPLKAAQTFFKTLRRSEGKFPSMELYIASLHYLDALTALYSDIRSFNANLLKKGRSTGWQKTTVHKTFETKTSPKIILDAIRLFEVGNGSSGSLLASQTLKGQHKSISRVCFYFLNPLTATAPACLFSRMQQQLATTVIYILPKTTSCDASASTSAPNKKAVSSL